MNYNSSFITSFRAVAGWVPILILIGSLALLT